MDETPAPTDIARVLRAAADVIDRNGWIQGAYFTPLRDRKREDCPVCAIGAINVAIHTDPLVKPSQGSTWQYVSVLDERLEQDVADWNDEPGRTADEVTQLLRDCANELEANA